MHPTKAEPEAAIVQYADELLQVDTRSDEDAFLVITNGFDPGWEATVDDRPARVLPADVAFQAVALPAGSHRVRLTYRSPTVRAGAWISLATLVVLTALFTAERLRLRRRVEVAWP